MTAAVSVVIPVYNSERSLPILVSRLEQTLRAREFHFEVILVNDGSRDESWSKILELSSSRSWLHGIHLSRNFGQHNALLCGIREAQYDTIITLDDDLQNPPEEIPKLLTHLATGYDVVYGTSTREQQDFWRAVASRIVKLGLRAALGAEIAPRISTFRAFRTSVRASFKNYESNFVSIDVLLSWGTTKFGWLNVEHRPREIGTSSYTFRKLLTHTLNMVTGFSVLPLQIASGVGFCFFLFGMGVLAYVVGRYLIQGGSVPGFPFLGSIIAIFSGAQLFALGIFGEYLARMHFRLIARPNYIVSSRTERIS